MQVPLSVRAHSLRAWYQRPLGQQLADAETMALATQLWHHFYLGGELCELPTWSPPVVNSVPANTAFQSITIGGAT